MWVLFHFPPATSTFYPQCVFRQATGFDCPGCGTTRALHELAHFRIKEAFVLNPMLFAIGALGVVAIPDVARRRRPSFLTRPWFAWGSLAAIVAWWIGRNVF